MHYRYHQRLHQQYPDKGYDHKSFEIFERKQGRVFLEEMGKSGARFFAGVPESLLHHERELETQLAQTRKQIAEKYAEVLTAPEQEHIKKLQQQNDTLKTEQKNLQTEIKRDYPDYYALKYPKPARFSELQQSVLQSGEVLMIYNVMKDHTALWVITPEAMQIYTLPVGEQVLQEKIANLRETMMDDWAVIRGLSLPDKKTPQSEKLPFPQVSHELYNLLVPEVVRPMLTSIQEGEQGRKLNIVPTGPLYMLPFELLLTHPAQDVQDAHYLIEDVPINYLSSASLLKTLRDILARRTSIARYPLLAFAHPTYNSEAFQDNNNIPSLRAQAYRALLRNLFIELPETADEARAIADVFNVPLESESLQLRENASRTRVFELQNSGRLDDYQYLLFAMHGVLPEEVEHVAQSALVLSDDFLTMADVFGLQLNARLVSLSACNTGMGIKVRGEGVMGLTRAFMYAGTPTVAVTLWSVESFSAKELDIGFFHHLNEGESPARALQTVKIQMLQGYYGEEYRYPYYWAPFVLFGEGRGN